METGKIKPTPQERRVYIEHITGDSGHKSVYFRPEGRWTISEYSEDELKLLGEGDVNKGIELVRGVFATIEEENFIGGGLRPLEGKILELRGERITGKLKTV